MYTLREPKNWKEIKEVARLLVETFETIQDIKNYLDGYSTDVAGRVLAVIIAQEGVR